MNCKQCNTAFEITKEDEIVHKKVDVPPPTICPDCRQQRRFFFRNDQNYYKNQCHICEKDLVSIYSPDKSIPVLCSDCFWSDKFNPLEYSQDFDFNRPFFEQYSEMRAKVPRLAIFNTQSENAEFTVHSSKNRNCYMSSSLVDCEDVHYSDFVMNTRDCIDILYSMRMEMCYECTDSQDCNRSNYLELCSNLSDSFLCFDCRGSQNLVGCVSIRNRQNCILNKPVANEECIETINKLKTDPKFFEEFRKKYDELKASIPKHSAWTINAENCTGNYITDSKNARHAYNARDCEDVRYVYDIKDVEDGYDVTRIAGAEMIYECCGIVDLTFSKFCNLTYQSDNMYYCDNSLSCSFCFGCMSLKQNKYCILNKKYSKDEYEEMFPRIIEHMKKGGEYGEFFPFQISPFGYNETKANEFYPLNKEEVLANGWNWSDFEPPPPTATKTIPAQRLPDDIKDVPNDILNWAIESEGNGKPYKIIQKELKFYRTTGLSIPHLTPKERHQRRVSLQNPRRLNVRECDNCQKTIKTTYSSDRPEKVYCDECYHKEVY